MLQPVKISVFYVQTYMHIKWHVLLHSMAFSINILHSCTYFRSFKRHTWNDKLKLWFRRSKSEQTVYWDSPDTLKAPFESILFRSMRWKPQLSKQRAFESAGWLPESLAWTTRSPVLRYCQVSKQPSRQRMVAAMSNIVTSGTTRVIVIVFKVYFWHCELKLTFSTRLFTFCHVRRRLNYIKLLKLLRALTEEIA